jgi:hypothetical protein
MSKRVRYGVYGNYIKSLVVLSALYGSFNNYELTSQG